MTMSIFEKAKTLRRAYEKEQAKIDLVEKQSDEMRERRKKQLNDVQKVAKVLESFLKHKAITRKQFDDYNEMYYDLATFNYGREAPRWRAYIESVAKENPNIILRNIYSESGGERFVFQDLKISVTVNLIDEILTYITKLTQEDFAKAMAYIKEANAKENKNVEDFEKAHKKEIDLYLASQKGREAFFELANIRRAQENLEAVTEDAEQWLKDHCFKGSD